MAEPITVPSRAIRVTFFEDRAAVEREAVVTIPAGSSVVVVEGLGAMVDDESLLASSKTEGTRVLSARVVRARRQESPVGEGELDARTRRVDELRAAAGRAQRAVARAEAHVARTGDLVGALITAVAQVPRGGADLGADLDAAYRVVDAETTAALDAAGRHRREVKDLAIELAQAEARLAEAEALVTRYVARVELAIESDAARTVTVDLSYRLPCALWRPEHWADLGKETIAWRTAAVAWQATGEEWRRVRCRFSTARPSRAAECPPLVDDLLHSRKKAEPRARVVVEAREESIHEARKGAAHVDEMPGVDDGGEPAWLEAPEPCDVPSDGRPVRVELAERAIACKVDRVAYPELSAAVHVRARATLAGGAPILAGPVVALRAGEVVGRSRVGFVAAGEPFEIGFGVDDALRVRRAVKTNRRTQAVTGTQIVKREVTLFGGNTGGRARRVRVIERVPVSEVEAVTITLDRVPPGARADDDGLVRMDLELEPEGTRKTSLEWTLEASSDVVLPPL